MVIGRPLHREIPDTSKSHPPGMLEIKTSVPQVCPPSVDLSKTNPSGPAHAT